MQRPLTDENQGNLNRVRSESPIEVSRTLVLPVVGEMGSFQGALQFASCSCCQYPDVNEKGCAMQAWQQEEHGGEASRWGEEDGTTDRGENSGRQHSMNAQQYAWLQDEHHPGSGADR